MRFELMRPVTDLLTFQASPFNHLGNFAYGADYRTRTYTSVTLDGLAIRSDNHYGKPAGRINVVFILIRKINYIKFVQVNQTLLNKFRDMNRSP